MNQGVSPHSVNSKKRRIESQMSAPRSATLAVGPNLIGRTGTAGRTAIVGA